MSSAIDASASGSELPIPAQFEFDATDVLVGMRLTEGRNRLMGSGSGLALMVTARSGQPLDFTVVDDQGQPAEEMIEIRVRTSKGTTCWECGKDAGGNTHCWKIPCPVIVGPWVPGQVMVRNFGFQSLA